MKNGACGPVLHSYSWMFISLKVPTQLAGSIAGVAELAQDARFDLPDTLAGDAKRFGYLFQRPRPVVRQAVPHLQDLALTLRQLVQDVFYLLLQHLA